MGKWLHDNELNCCKTVAIGIAKFCMPVNELADIVICKILHLDIALGASFTPPAIAISRDPHNVLHNNL